jgi:hypothetical protein
MLSLNVGTMAQGTFNLDDESIPSGLVADAPGNWYSGTFGMEVWELNGTSIPAGINLSAAPGSGVLGYNVMVATGFVKEMTYAGQTTTGPDAFALGPADMSNVSPIGATVVVALAAWNTGAASWSAMLANANQATRAGVVAFVQPTGFYSGGLPPGLPGLGMSQDLVLSAIPEPPAAALAGLGGALLLLFRRRRCCARRTRSERA